MKNLVILILSSMALLSCAEKYTYDLKDTNQAFNQVQNTAESLEGYDMVWKCVGRTFATSNEFMVATLQKHPTNLNMILTVDRVVLAGNYYRYGIFMSEVTATTVDPELELIAYTPKNQENLPINDRRMLAKMSSKSQLLILDLVKYGDHSLSINCPTGDIFY